MNMPTWRVMLIGGPSHTGKTTLARALAARLGWRYMSTDGVARYPGRPWGGIPAHVAEHYRALSPDELIEDVIRHYARIWPDVRSAISAHAGDHATERLVLEGSALWPEFVATLHVGGVRAIWLTASEHFLQQRIFAGSRYEQAPAQAQAIIEKFVGRAQRYNRRMLQALERLGFPWIDVEQTSALEQLIDACLDGAFAVE